MSDGPPVVAPCTLLAADGGAPPSGLRVRRSGDGEVWPHCAPCAAAAGVGHPTPQARGIRSRDKL